SRRLFPFRFSFLIGVCRLPAKAGVVAAVRSGGFLACFVRAAEKQERQGEADPCQYDEREEGGLEALVQDDERIRGMIGWRVVVGAGEGKRGGDGDAKGGADLEGGVAEARGKPGLVLGDARERRDRGGHEGEADPGTEDK